MLRQIRSTCMRPRSNSSAASARADSRSSPPGRGSQGSALTPTASVPAIAVAAVASVAGPSPSSNCATVVVGIVGVVVVTGASSSSSSSRTAAPANESSSSTLPPTAEAGTVTPAGSGIVSDWPPTLVTTPSISTLPGAPGCRSCAAARASST